MKARETVVFQFKDSWQQPKIIRINTASAEECVKLAQSARTDQRSTLLEIVQAWLGLADQAAERLLLNGDGAKTGEARQREISLS